MTSYYITFASLQDLSEVPKCLSRCLPLLQSDGAAFDLPVQRAIQEIHPVKV